jgi:hypothetical protein
MKKLTKLLTIGVLVAFVVGVCGCTNPVQTAQNAVSPSNKAVDYGNAFVNVIKQNPGENSVITSSSVVANGSDAALMSVTIQNNTHNASSLWQNGSTETIAFNVKQFSSTDDASSFYAKQSFGLSAEPAKNVSEGQTNVVSPYKTVTGNDPTTVKAASGDITFNWISAGVTLVSQTNEFVIYGTISITAA